jgi:ATP-binding cassette subfamily B protein
MFIMESTYTVDKLLFKIIIDRGTEFAAGTLAKDSFIQKLIMVLIIFASILIVRVVAKWLYIHTINRLDANLIFDLKRKFFNHIICLSHDFHTTHKTGSLISRLIRGGGAIENVTDVIIFNFAPLLFQLIVVSSSLYYFDRTSAFVVLITVATFLGYSLLIQNWQKEANVYANDMEDVEKANISDIFTNIDSIKYFGKEITIKKRFSQLSQITKNAWQRNWDYYRWLDSGQSLILGVGIFFLIYFPLIGFLGGQLSLGTLVFIFTVFGNLSGPLFGFVHGIKGFYKSMADFEALFRYGKIENEIKDKPDAQILKIKNGTIKFKNINFKYNQVPLFENFNLEIPANKKIALVGHSGSGKSTLVKLLYRLYDVDAGQILIDGKDIKDVIQESLRSEMSIVPQECVLFDDTIYNNIAFSRPQASKKEVMEAMKFAQMDKVVANFPEQENTIVGERGVKLSGGEKQRVSIARAILADKKILVLDEATSSLDSRTESEIQADLEKLMQGRTSIIIAHRLSTIMKADKIIVMKEGKIVQSGTHNELIAQDGEYKGLWELQKGGYIE